MSDYHDRTYWRQCSLKTLIEQARDSQDELAIALGERLEEYEAQEETLADIMQENDDLARQVQSLAEDNAYLSKRLSLDQDEDD